jgi:radical SAM superfamily enzyme YgiQ (UPF0313 family)
LYANLHELQDLTQIAEFTINDQIETIGEKLLAYSPKIIAIGVYIWNAKEVKELVDIIKLVKPDIKVILGGPEVSYTPLRVDFERCDHIIQGEAEVSFYKLCQTILDDPFYKKERINRIIKAQLPDIKTLQLPYSYYTQHDIDKRFIYIEASRGCPFSCEFCLSSIDEKVRYFDIDKIIDALQMLYNKGARTFKFIDRTFNLNMKIANRLLDFFLSLEPPYFVHFEVIPDTFPKKLRQKLQRFHAGSLQLEVGIQTLNETVAKGINRHLNMPKIIENLDFLQNETQAHLHLDLIIGLPNESIESFAANLDRLYSLSSSEIQLGVLKKLSGTTINRHDEAAGAVYSPTPPYDILQNGLIPYEQMQELKRMARFWDIYYNSGNFTRSMKRLFEDASVFERFYALSKYIYRTTDSTWKISLDRAAYLLYEYMLQTGIEPIESASLLIEDVTKVKGRKLPKFLKEIDGEYKLSSYHKSNEKYKKVKSSEESSEQDAALNPQMIKNSLNKRQQRHI